MTRRRSVTALVSTAKDEIRRAKFGSKPLLDIDADRISVWADNDSGVWVRDLSEPEGWRLVLDD